MSDYTHRWRLDDCSSGWSRSSYLTKREQEYAAEREKNPPVVKRKRNIMKREDLGEGYYMECFDGTWFVFRPDGTQVHYPESDDIEPPIIDFEQKFDTDG
jgi:hypothetical protein